MKPASIATITTWINSVFVLVGIGLWSHDPNLLGAAAFDFIYGGVIVFAIVHLIIE